MSHSIEALNLIRSSPEECLTQRSIILARPFLVGYEMAMMALNIKDTGPGGLLSEFTKVLNAKFGLRGSHDAALAMELVSPDTEAAFLGYFRELDAFLKNVNFRSPKTEPIAKSKPAGVGKAADVSSLLVKIREMPTMYFGVKSFTALRNFLNGYQQGLLTVADARISNPALADFEKWLKRRQRLPQQCRWDRIITFSGMSDEAMRFDLFYKLLDEFNAARPLRKNTRSPAGSRKKSSVC